MAGLRLPNFHIHDVLRRTAFWIVVSLFLYACALAVSTGPRVGDLVPALLTVAHVAYFVALVDAAFLHPEPIEASLSKGPEVDAIRRERRRHQGWNATMFAFTAVVGAISMWKIGSGALPRETGVAVAAEILLPVLALLVAWGVTGLGGGRRFAPPF